MNNHCLRSALFALLVVGGLVAGLRASDQARVPRNSDVRTRPVTVFVLDVLGDGFRFSSVENGVLFDVDGRGQAIRTAWTISNDDGLLVIDRNGNGMVDSGNEFVGDGCITPTGTRVTTGADALAVLQGFDRLTATTPPPSHLNIIDSTDDIFGKLGVWNDVNRNGKTERGELKSLPSLNIIEIYITFSQLPQIPDVNGNVAFLEGPFYVNRREAQYARRMAEIRLAR